MPVACIDLDGVLAYFDRWKGADHIGDPIPTGVSLVRKLVGRGFRIIIYSCRLNGSLEGCDYVKSYNLIREWLNRYRILYDKIAVQSDGKPYADVYIDDRNVYFLQNSSDMSIVDSIVETICKISGTYSEEVMSFSLENINGSVSLVKLKCPECGSYRVMNHLDCLDCGYEYFEWNFDKVDDRKYMVCVML